MNILRKIVEKQGDAGQAAMALVTVSFFAVLGTVSSGVVPVIGDVHMKRELEVAKQVHIAADAGVEDAAYRVRTGRDIDASETISLNDATVTTDIVDDISAGTKEIISLGKVSNAEGRNSMVLFRGSGTSFNYGVQAGEGGFFLDNSSSVQGNVYSNGSVIGKNHNVVTGSVVSAGPSGYLEELAIGGDAIANTLNDLIVSGDAYYQVMVGAPPNVQVQGSSIISGILFPNSPDQEFKELPLSDDDIAAWEQIALAGGVTNCNGDYVIENNVTIGPTVFPCKLIIKGGANVTLAGMIWVQGDVEIENSGVVSIDNSLGANSLAIIAHNPNDTTDSSTILLKNNTQFNGSGSEGSYIFLVSMNDSEESGGSNSAITHDNNAGGDIVLYASHGKIEINNNVDLKSATAYKIEMKNNASITYEEGLASTLFSSGPGGSWEVKSWKQIE